MTLALCAGCNRHVREGACPFCGDDSERAAPSPGLKRRYGRAAILLVGGALAAAAAGGCGDTNNPGDDAGVAAGEIIAPYGTPALLETLV